MAPRTDNDRNRRKSTTELIITYLSNTRPWVICMHLLWMLFVCIMLSSSYILAFHFEVVRDVYEHASLRGELPPQMTTAQSENINSKLTTMLGNTGSDRAYVFQYHSEVTEIAGSALIGVPYKYQSNTYEVIGPGAIRVKQFSQKAATVANLFMNNHFMRNECAIITDTSQDPDSQNYWYFVYNSAISVVRCPMFNHKGDIIGFIGIDYLKRNQGQTALEAAEIVKSFAKDIAKIIDDKH